MPPSLRALVISSVLGALTLYIYLSTFASSSPSFYFHTKMSTSGYVTRATPLPHSTQLSREDLKLAVLRNAPVETEGFTLALFDPDVAVTHTGAIVKLQKDDFDALLALASQTSSLPTPKRFFNAWVINQQRTSQPIDRVLIPLTTLSMEPGEEYKEEYREVSVQGYEKGKTELKQAVGEYTTLPESLGELVGLALEAREGGESDEEVVTRVKGLLGNVY